MHIALFVSSNFEAERDVGFMLIHQQGMSKNWYYMEIKKVCLFQGIISN
jgi:hypothetical protein